MIQCSNCDRTFSSKGIKNHEMACQGKTKLTRNPNTFGEALIALFKLLGRLQLSWFVPEWNILSLLFYCLVVYPVAYMVFFRLLFAPVWDLVCLVWTIGQHTARFYDRLGFTPKSIPKEDTKAEGDFNASWALLVSIADLIKNFGNAPA